MAEENRYREVLIMGLCFFPILVLHLWAPQDINTPITRATMHGDCIYTSGIMGKDRGTRWSFGGGNLWILRTDLKGAAKVTALDYMHPTSPSPDELLRWQVIGGHFHSVAYKNGPDGFGTTSAATRAGRFRSIPLAAIEAPDAYVRNPQVFPGVQKFKSAIRGGPGLNPVAMEIGVGRGEKFLLGVFFDFWCRGEDRFEVYVNVREDSLATAKSDRPAKANRLVRADFHPENEIAADQDPKILWEKVSDWTYDWEGPFYVAASGDDRYFVTDTGRVFAAPRKAKAGTPLKEIWKGKPVDALIHDSDSSKWYAFTKDQYFEIADPIKPIAHTLTIKRSLIADDALKTAAKCGRVIRGIPEPKGK